MPTVRFTYARDVARFGSQPVEVPDVTARRLLADRRAELVPAEVPPSSPDCAAGCAICDGCP